MKNTTTAGNRAPALRWGGRMIALILAVLGLATAMLVSGCPMSAPPAFNLDFVGVTTGGAQDIALARKIIEAGDVPNPEYIPIEGFLSEHAIPLPRVDETRTLYATGAVSWNRDFDEITPLVTLQVGFGTNIDRATFTREPLNLCLVIDKSGSMNDVIDERTRATKWEAVRIALDRLLSNLNSDDRVSVVTFDEDAIALLQGAADMTDRLRDAPPGENPVLDYVLTAALFEEQGMDIRVLSTWGKRLEALGLWYDQLLSESLGKHERGATPITGVNTRDLHSRGQQHQEGRRDKLITNVIVESPSATPLGLPAVPASENQDELNKHARKTLPEFLSAAIEGTNKAYADDNRPTADIFLPHVDAYCMGQLLQMLMLATVVEGCLIGINPYGQPGVEAYKQNMNEILNS